MIFRSLCLSGAPLNFKPSSDPKGTQIAPLNFKPSLRSYNTTSGVKGACPGLRRSATVSAFFGGAIADSTIAKQNTAFQDLSRRSNCQTILNCNHLLSVLCILHVFICDHRANRHSASLALKKPRWFKDSKTDTVISLPDLEGRWNRCGAHPQRGYQVGLDLLCARIQGPWHRDQNPLAAPSPMSRI